MPTDPQTHWKGRKILHAGDHDALESAAAIKEFHDGYPRQQAEERAYSDYRSGHHEDARAHHHAGMQAALAVGDHESAHKHGMMYDFHTRALGKDPMAGIDASLQARLDANRAKHYRFRAHKADGFIVHEMAKAEGSSLAPVMGNRVLGHADPARAAAASRPFEKAEGDKPKASYQECPHCEANFKLAPGEKFPPHRYRGVSCPGADVKKGGAAIGNGTTDVSPGSVSND